MAKIKSFGADVYVNGIAVGGLTDINASGTDVTMIDSTSHDSAGGYRTFLAGLKDGGTLELTGKYNYADVGQAELKAEEGVKHAFYIILSDNSGLAFYGYVGGFQTSNPLDDAVEFTATAKVTGEVLPVFPTLTVTGTLTYDGSNPTTFAAFSIGIGEEMFYGGKIQYRASGDHYVYYDAGWYLRHDSTGPNQATFINTSSSVTPPIGNYSPVAPATGTATLTGS